VKEQLDMLICVQVCRTIELNSNSQSQVLVIKYQDSKHKGKYMIQKKSCYEFDTKSEERSTVKSKLLSEEAF